MKKWMSIMIFAMGILTIQGCDASHSVQHFEAPLAVYEDDRADVVYRVPFPEMTTYQYTKMSGTSRRLQNYDFSHIGITCETIDGTDAFEWIDAYFREHHTVEDTDEHCSHRVTLEEHTLCYRDYRESDTSANVGIYIE